MQLYFYSWYLTTAITYCTRTNRKQNCPNEYDCLTEKSIASQKLSDKELSLVTFEDNIKIFIDFNENRIWPKITWGSQCHEQNFSVIFFCSTF